jgi:hypothetical protein
MSRSFLCCLGLYPLVAAAERGRLHPVLAGRRAETAAGVLRHIDEHAVARRPVARAEPGTPAGADDPCQPFGADRRVHGDELSIDGVMVQSPSPSLLGEVGTRRVLGQQDVQPGCRAIDLSALQVREDFPQVLGERYETRHVVTA